MLPQRRVAACLLAVILTLTAVAAPIDREALVRRHNPTSTRLDPLAPFSVGNGGFAFTADITGLQTFTGPYDNGIALHTESQWGWHSFPNRQGYKLADTLKNMDVHGRNVPYACLDTGPAATWLRANPHRLDLARIGLILHKEDGTPALPGDISKIKQTLDMWSGILTSEFEFRGQPVRVRTACHPQQDLLAVDIESPLLEAASLGVSISFPGARADWKDNADWTTPDAHQTVMSTNGAPQSCLFARTLDDCRYSVRAMWSAGALLHSRGPHEFSLSPSAGTHPNGANLRLIWDGRVRLKAGLPTLESAFMGRYVVPPSGGIFCPPCSPKLVKLAPFGTHLWCVYSFSAQTTQDPLPNAAETIQASADHWQKFWSAGGAIDLSGSSDARAGELERRLVLSQYLTAIQCAGTMPPQETGLTLNSWFGKAHTEMHWWHAAQFALWGRVELLEKSLPWYDKILPVAKALAKRQGYQGARWPKMVDPDGAESPSKVAGFLIWEQPHPIYLAELCYRAQRGSNERATLQKYQEMVFQTAEFMASYAWWNQEKSRYDLGPALIPAQECHDPAVTLNPTFELAYWQWALSTAQLWRERLGMPRDPKWDHVIEHLAKPNIRDGVYTAVESASQAPTHDHFSMLDAFGFLPKTPLIDIPTMNRTLDWVNQVWDWQSTWGWDYPTLAMTAARLGRPEDAIRALLMDTKKNTYLPNGHNYQDKRLPVYLPGNGGLLAAAALMAAGWDGAPSHDAPGFPHDGKWQVHSEGLLPMP